MRKRKPVENERYSVDQDGDWFRVLYTRYEESHRTTYNDRPIAHYETKEKAERIANILNESSEL